MVRGVLDSGMQDGYKALSILNHRYDAKTTSSLLKAFMDSVSPPSIKSGMGIVKGVHEWEASVSTLKCRYNEEINTNNRLAILIGMLPKEYQDICIQASCVMEKMTYEKMRDHIFNVANQRLPKPKPMEVDEIDEQEIDAVGNMLCYNCNKNGHISRNCWQKGGGKGNTKGNPGKGGYQ